MQQMRRASKSIPSNIAEGYARRKSVKEFKLYLAYALGSTNELLVHLKVAEELGYASLEETNRLTEAYSILGRQINKLIQNWK